MHSILNKLIKAYPYKPYSYLKFFGVSLKQVDNYFQHQIEDWVNKQAVLVTHEEDSKVCGFALYTYQEFDTNILGLKTSKVDIVICNSDCPVCHDQIVKRLIKSFKKNKIEYVTFRLNSQDLRFIHKLEENGFRIVDSYLILVKEIDELISFRKDPKIFIRDAEVTDISPLQNSIAPTFIYSRFFQDYLISKKRAIEMHKQWIANSIMKKVADHVFVLEYQDKPIGFITLEMEKDSQKYFGKKIGRFPLIGIHPDFRGKQLAQVLTNEAVNRWFKAHGADLIKIETQLINFPATRTYENTGFRVVDFALTLRWSNKS